MRIFLPIVLAALAGCGSTESTITEPPPQVHGGWLRSSLAEAGPDSLPASVKSLPAKKIWKASYRGPQDIKGIWIQYGSDTVAFEAIQKIAKSPAIWPFHRGPFLVVLDAEGVPRQALGDFQEGVAKAIP